MSKRKFKTVATGKGAKCRLTVLPLLVVPALRRHLAWRKALHDQEVAEGRGLVELPGRLAVKYKSAPRDFAWQWLFPSSVLRGQYRWHATDGTVSKQMRMASVLKNYFQKTQNSRYD